jgi:tetratricopeptide (TPR) repeat protein
MKRERVPGPLFNLYLWGGYELWRLFPDYQVFFDGRTHVYGEAVVRDYLTVAMVHPDWKSVLDRWGIQSVLTAATSPLTQALESSRDWRLVFVDHEAILFVRDVAENRALFDRIGRVARPTPRSVVRAALNAGVRAAERGEDETAVRRFQEVLAADAGNPVALYSLGLLLDRRGERVEAERLWHELRRLAPDSQLAAMAENELKKPRTRSIR